MKKIVVLLFATVLFNFNCGGSNDSDDEYAGDADVTTEDDAGGDAENPEAACIDCDVNMLDEGADVGEDWLPETEDLVDCPVGCTCCADYDCACLKWPQVVEYMWLVGTWKRVECDGGSCADETIRDLVIESWDDDLGANILELAPFSNGIYLKKNPNSGQFEFGNPKEGSFSLISGTADPILFKITTTHYMTSNPDEIHTIVWEKVK